MSDTNKLSDGSNDRVYFTQTPRLVWALCRDPYDYTLWDVIKTIAGEKGECTLSTPDLAALAMMSAGKVTSSRKHLIKVGLLEGEIIRDPGFPQPVWHLRVPDIWRENLEWAQDHLTVSSRIAYKKAQKKSVHQVKAAKERSPGEKGTTPGERKKNHKEEPLNNDDGNPPTFADVIKAYEQQSGTINGFISEELQAAVDEWEDHRSKLPGSHPDKDRPGCAVLLAAIEEMGKHISPPNLKYLDRILTGWRRRGFMAAKPQKRNRSKNGSAPPIDYEAQAAEIAESTRERLQRAKAKQEAREARQK